MNNPKKILILGSLCFLLFSLLPVSASDGTNLKRYALFIGANDGGAERVYLRYAESDALSMARVMKDIGGINSPDSRVLLNPESDDLTESLQEISDWVNETKAEANRVEFLLYYSGHSDEYGLLLKGGTFPYQKLKDAINQVEADVHIAILDSCSSGSFTRLKGGQRQRPFLMDESVDTSGYAFLTSSSEDEAAQESDEIEGSFFTHFLLSGLMGAADHSGNSQVSLNEAYTYASEQTLARTEQTLAGAQHPSYDMKLSGSGDLVLTDLRAASAGMSISQDIDGRLFIRDSSGKLLAEINKVTGEAVTIALPPGYYTITLEQGERLSRTSLSIDFNQTQNLSTNLFQQQSREYTTIRGNQSPDEKNDRESIEEMVRIALETAFISDDSQEYLVDGIAVGFIDSVNSVEGIQLGFITDLSGYLDGAQISSIFGNIDDGMNGFQLAGIFNVLAGDSDGVQVSGIFNTAGGIFNGVQVSGIFNEQNLGTMDGLQIGGIFNDHSGGPFDGFQIAGIFNSSRGVYNGFQLGGIGNIQEGGELSGSQIGGIFNIAGRNLFGVQAAGIYNSAKDVSGLQMGLINNCDDIEGSQIGLINISRNYKKGFPVGLINISRNGLHNFSAWSDSVNNAYGGFQLGTRSIYTIYYLGTSIDNPWEEVSLGIGMGTHIDFRSFYIESDISAKVFFQPGEMNNPDYWKDSNIQNYPSLRLVAGLKLSPFLSIIGGVNIDAWFPDVMDSTLYPLKEGELVETFNDWGFTMEYVPRWFLGVRI